MSNKTLDINNELLSYILNTSANESDVAKRLREETMTLEMRNMQIAPEQAVFMSFMAKLINAKKYLEIGVFTGYSMLHVVEAMGDGSRATGCDISKEWTDIAKRYWSEAGIDKSIDLFLDKAEITLKTLVSNTYDIAFIDADKVSYDFYYEQCLRLLKPNAQLMIDNIFWGGLVAKNSINDTDTKAIRALNTKIMSDSRVDASMLSIGDGLMLVKKI